MANRAMPLLGSLRTRLIAAFVLVAALSAVTATALAYHESRNFIVTRTQTALEQDFRQRVSGLAREFDVPPSRQTLKRFADDVSQAGLRDADVIVGYQGLTASSRPGADESRITPTMRAAVRTGDRLNVQRITKDGRPWLVLGTPVTFEESHRTSGLEVYAIVSLQDEERDVSDLLRTVRNGTIPIIVLAAVLALLAARTVLRPVRNLGDATRRLAAGELGARAQPTGRDELADLAHTFNATAQALQTSVTDLREQEATARRFAADVSHELRTPLTAMTIVSNVLDEEADQLPPDSATAMRTVSAETAKLARLVDDLIEISRFDAKAIHPNRNEIDVGDTIRATLTVRGWHDDVHTDLPDESVRALLDRRRLDVIVANLVGNALRHGAPPVTVTLRASDAEITIEVTDHGPGLNPEVIRHVFDRFYKADTARTRSEGSGLGMAIAQENARLHGGTIHADNRLEGGAMFTLRLPRHVEGTP
ncbi:HAMP domain-containing sensor histidine kinase [Saccharopolyspora shandongensis]|uniref:HAMP domain-containing sensor histidine kinase n=1 Tax=Saccharopolyspora shandongensis TaxID=418495 RepID=UPI0033F31F40